MHTMLQRGYIQTCLTALLKTILTIKVHHRNLC